MIELLAASLLSVTSPAWAFVVPSMVKVRPGMALPHGATIGLVLGRGECGAAQVVVPEGAPVFDLRANAGRLAGPNGKALSLALSREGYLNIQQPSNVEGRVGPWPDILIPEVDPIVHEARRAFPFDAQGALPTVVWVQLCTPLDAVPGNYQGTISLTARHKPQLDIPVAVRVLHYTIPATSTFPTAFGFSGRLAALAHGMDPKDPAQVLAITKLYGKLALLHRISFFGMSNDAPPFHVKDGQVAVDFGDYDREVGPFLDGTVLPSGARFTSLELRGPSGKVDDAIRISYYRQTVEHLKEHGWLGRLFLYAPDELSPAQFARVRAVSNVAHQASANIRVLLTASDQPGLSGVADIWTPNMVCLFPRPEGPACPSMSKLSDYSLARAKGRKLWWYQSCMSHGCGPSVGKAAVLASGWPAYMVDLPASLNRAMGVGAYRFGIEGELYYQTDEAYDGDPWQSVWRFNGNGDGTLFYPGRPERIGGHTEIPLSSMRLEYIREGLQDYELLKLADGLGLHTLAQQTAIKLVPTAWNIERDPKVWSSLRRTLAEAVDAKVRAQVGSAKR